MKATIDFCGLWSLRLEERITGAHVMLLCDLCCLEEGHEELNDFSIGLALLTNRIRCFEVRAGKGQTAAAI